MDEDQTTTTTTTSTATIKYDNDIDDEHCSSKYNTYCNNPQTEFYFVWMNYFFQGKQGTYS